MGQAADGVFHELGLVTRDDYVELELRVAQLEHRLRLLEGEAPAPALRQAARIRPESRA